MTTLRIVREYIQFQKANHQNIFFKPNENDCRKIKALIIGPPDTPYEGAILLFDILAANYPLKPPIVKFVSYSGGRIHKNFADFGGGNICMSILSTEFGDGWSPLFTIEKILLSILTILNIEPFVNQKYNLVARYFSLLFTMNISKQIGQGVDYEFKDIIQEYIIKNKEVYIRSMKLLEPYRNKYLEEPGNKAIIQINIGELEEFYGKL